MEATWAALGGEVSEGGASWACRWGGRVRGCSRWGLSTLAHPRAGCWQCHGRQRGREGRSRPISPGQFAPVSEARSTCPSHLAPTLGSCQPTCPSSPALGLPLAPGANIVRTLCLPDTVSQRPRQTDRWMESLSTTFPSEGSGPALGAAHVLGCRPLSPPQNMWLPHT